MSRTKRDLSVWNKPLIDTCQHCSTSRANQALRSLANAGFQNRGVCLQAFPSFPSPSPLFHFLALVSFLAQSKPKVPFLGISLLWNQTETLATQASWTPDIIINFYCLRWQIPWGGTLELSNHPLGWGQKREQMPRPPWTLQHFSLTALLSSAILSIFNVRFFVSVNVCLCNNTILI